MSPARGRAISVGGALGKSAYNTSSKSSRHVSMPVQMLKIFPTAFGCSDAIRLARTTSRMLMRSRV